jgi:DNA mismatch repair protein MSH6
LYKLVDGIATSSFGTHVAKLAGVPNEVVERADAISRDFAQQFKAKIEDRKKSKTANAALPLVAQADFAYLLSLALGKSPMPENPVRRREVLLGLKAAMRNCLRS